MVHVLSTALLLSSVVVLVIVLYLLDLSEGQAFNYIIDLTGATAAACIRSARSQCSLTTTALRSPPDNGGGVSTAASSCPAPSPGSCTGWTRGWVVQGRRWLCSGVQWPSWCPPSSSPTTERASERVTTDGWMGGPRHRCCQPDRRARETAGMAAAGDARGAPLLLIGQRVIGREV